MGAAALFAGAIYPLGFAPFKWWVIALVSAVLLYIAIKNAATGRRAFLWAWLFGVGKYAVGASWIYVSIHVHGQAPIPLALMLVAVFDWPGMGRLYFEAISVMDLPIIIGATYVLTVLFLISILVADLLYGYFDPRVKTE